MDWSRQTSSALDELRQIQAEVRRAQTLDDLRFYFDRVQLLRRAHSEDFDLQMAIAETHDQVVDRGRQLREAEPKTPAPVHLVRPGADPVRADTQDEASLEAGENLQRLDAKTWQRATYLALFFALLLFFAFFYLVQTARRLNFPQTTGAQPATGEEGAKAQPVEKAENQGAEAPVHAPALRVYTDLVPASLSVDNKEPQELTDGEFTLDNVEPGRHSVRISAKSSSAAVSFDVTANAAPRVIGQPEASNVMAVAVSSEDGKGSLITNADHPAVVLDGKPLGESDTSGISLGDLGKTDHDLQVTENKDRQRFVLTYTPAPTLTLYVKADPSAGTVVVNTGQDEADVFFNDIRYRRRTDHGQVRIPMKVGEYTIRVHKPGFIDPPPQKVQVKKGEESALDFKLEPVPQIATLQVKGAPQGTMVYVDKNVAAVIGSDGTANVSNIKPGDHTVELKRDQALPKKFERTFQNGEVVVLSGPDTTLDRVVVDNKQPAVPTDRTAETAVAKPEPKSLHIPEQQVRKGGGFVAYNVPRAPGTYSFQAQSRKSGFFRHGKVQWYAGYADPNNYILYSLDGKRASVKQVKDGRTVELGKIPFDFDNEDWIQVYMQVKASSIVTRIKTPLGGWQELPAVAGIARDLTQDKMGMYLPGNDEMAIANFRFTHR